MEDEKWRSAIIKAEPMLPCFSFYFNARSDICSSMSAPISICMEGGLCCLSLTCASLNTLAVIWSMPYDLLYTTSLMPCWIILMAHPRQGQVLQYNTTPLSNTKLPLPASSKAFSSACMQRHLSSPVPHEAPSLQRPHPPSLQLRRPRGVPL